VRHPLRILTWHVHGSYMEYLAHVPHEFWLPVKEGRPEGYGGRAPHWRDNVLDVPAEEVRNREFDVVLYQSHRNWLVDRGEILSDAQRALPQIFLEHDPPREVPTDTRHPVDDPDVLLVHVTPFNALMWDNGHTPVRIIDHGVTVPAGAAWTGEVERGLSVVNGLEKRGRRLGADVFARMRERVPLDLVGIDSERSGGLGEVPHTELADFEAAYRFFFNPIRYTSMGLAVCEAMMLGMPIVGLATTEMATAIENGVSGYVDTDLGMLAERMQALLADHALAAKLGRGAREQALERFHIERFVRDWDAALRDVAG
jgi:hypothetical protein